MSVIVLFIVCWIYILINLTLIPRKNDSNIPSYWSRISILDHKEHFTASHSLSMISYGPGDPQEQ